MLAIFQGANAQGPPSYYYTVVEAHGIIGCLAWVIFFPLGAIAIRLLNTPKAWLVHAIIQIFAYMLVITNAGLGIWMALVSGQLNHYHPEIGLVLFTITFFQAIGGMIHHYLFTKQKRSTFLVQMHIWLGRTLITLGMINGGLGMLFGSLFGSHPTRSEHIVYGVVAGAIWLSWILVVVFVNVKGKKADAFKTEQVAETDKGRTFDDSQAFGQL